MPAKPKAAPDPTDTITADSGVAEQMVMAAAADGAELSYEEKTFLRTRLAMDDRDIRRELARARQVVRNRQVAGTEADRKAMAAELERATKARDERAPGIEAEIERLQKELRRLHRDVDTATRRSAEMEEAVEKLADVYLLPPGIKQQYLEASRNLRDGVGRELLDLRGEVEHIKRKLTWDPADYRTVVDFIRVESREFVDYLGESRWAVNDKWHRHIKECRERLPELEKQLAELEAEHEREKAEAHALLRHYVR